MSAVTLRLDRLQVMRHAGMYAVPGSSSSFRSVASFRLLLCPHLQCGTTHGEPAFTATRSSQALLSEIAAHEYDHAAYFNSKAGNQAFTKPQVGSLPFYVSHMLREVGAGTRALDGSPGFQPAV